MIRSNSGGRSSRVACLVSAALLIFAIYTIVQKTPIANAQNSQEQTIYSVVFNEVKTWLEDKELQLENTVFISYDSNGSPYSSITYVYDDFLRVLERVSVAGLGGGAKRFYIGADKKRSLYGLVNIAAFLAHAMTVSIKYDVCDEFNRDDYTNAGKLPISNSCGQWGRSDQDEACVGNSTGMTCEVNIDATITATSTFENGNKIPPAFQCKPMQNEFAGYWDVETDEIVNKSFANRNGRTDLAGCCWWGRGVMMTRGTCNFGRVNHYLGMSAALNGYANFYDVDFCVYPEVVCDSPFTKDLRWAVGYFSWIDQVQTYNELRNYMEELNSLVDSRFDETVAEQFIDIVGWALPVGCLQASWNCASGPDAEYMIERRNNFLSLIDVLALKELLLEDTTTPTTMTEANVTIDNDTSVIGNDTSVIGNDTNAVGNPDGSGGNITETDDSLAGKFWQPINFNNFEQGYCVSNATNTSMFSYESELDCCVEYFNVQEGGYCLSHLDTSRPPLHYMPVEMLPRNPSKKPTMRPTNDYLYDTTYEPTGELVSIPSGGFQTTRTSSFSWMVSVITIIWALY